MGTHPLSDDFDVRPLARTARERRSRNMVRLRREEADRHHETFSGALTAGRRPYSRTWCICRRRPHGWRSDGARRRTSKH